MNRFERAIIWIMLFVLLYALLVLLEPLLRMWWQDLALFWGA